MKCTALRGEPGALIDACIHLAVCILYQNVYTYSFAIQNKRYVHQYVLHTYDAEDDDIVSSTGDLNNIHSSVAP